MAIDLDSLDPETREAFERLRSVNMSMGAYVKIVEGALLAAWTAGQGPREALWPRATTNSATAKSSSEPRGSWWVRSSCGCTTGVDAASDESRRSTLRSNFSLVESENRPRNRFQRSDSRSTTHGLSTTGNPSASRREPASMDDLETPGIDPSTAPGTQVSRETSVISLVRSTSAGGLGQDTDVVVGEAAPTKRVPAVFRILPKHPHTTTEEPFVKVGHQPLTQIVQTATPFLRDRAWNLIRHRCGAGSLAARIAKDVEPRESQSLDRGDGLFEFLLGFSRKPDHDVGGDRDIRDGLACSIDQLGETADRGLARHPHEGGITATLQRQVEVGQKPRIAEDLEEPGVEVPRLERGELGASEYQFRRESSESGPRGRATGRDRARRSRGGLRSEPPLGNPLSPGFGPRPRSLRRPGCGRGRARWSRHRSCTCCRSRPGP